MNWKLSNDERTWEYRDESGALADSLTWDNIAACYRDRDGRRLGNRFDLARLAVETNNKPEEPQEAQGRLAL